MFAPRTDPLLAPIAPAAPARMPAALVVLVLSLLLGIQPVTTDLYLPALPALSASLVFIDISWIVAWKGRGSSWKSPSRFARLCGRNPVRHALRGARLDMKTRQPQFG